MPKAKQSLDELLHEIKRIEEHREILTEKKIRKIYKQLLKELHGFIGEEYAKHANDQGALSYSFLRDRSRQARFLEEVVAKVDSITPELRAEIMGLVEDTYKSCYEGMGKAVQAASNTEELAKTVKGGLVTPDVVNQSFNNSISKLTLPNVLEKHRQEIVYAIKSELTIGLINGDRYEKMARRLTDKLDISYGKATRIVRTESHRNIESGLYDCAERIAEKMEGSGLVSVCTWRTMKDDRVRPNVRRKTKKGWKTYKSKNGADHVAMEGKTVRVGDFFVFPDGVKTKCPSKSGEARHDCNCRCFLEYDVMTEEEFAKVDANAPTITVTNKIDTGVENSNESDIISLNRNVERKEKNTGAFANLEIPMQKRYVLSTCQKYNIDTKGLTFKIQRSEGMLKTTYFGSADPDNIGRIDLFPNAFATEEELVKTILHEKCHYMQLKKYGKKYVQEHLAEMEARAYRFERVYYYLLRKRVTQ